MTQASGFSHRLAARADLPALEALMTMAIRQLVGAYLDPVRVEASFEIMGVDTQLIDDDTYFAIEHEGRIVGCGGDLGSNRQMDPPRSFDLASIQQRSSTTLVSESRCCRSRISMDSVSPVS